MSRGEEWGWKLQTVEHLEDPGAVGLGEKVKGARGRCDCSFKLYQELREGRGSAGNLEALLAPGDKPETNRRSQKM